MQNLMAQLNVQGENQTCVTCVESSTSTGASAALQLPPQQHQGICHSVVPIKLFLLKLCPFLLLFYGNIFSNYLVSFSVNIMWSSTNTATHCHLIPGYSFSERSFLCRNFLDLGCEKAK